jgi:NADPH-dependent glutamate synthase beta subunit-like oxidoreductase
MPGTASSGARVPPESMPVASAVAVLGSGSWGTALAIQFARAGHPTVL